MPIWLQVMLGIAVPLFLGIVSWLAREFWALRIKVVTLEKDIATINQRCAWHSGESAKLEAQTTMMRDAINRIDRNIVLLGSKVGAVNLEHP